ncbi:hypothetical protein [Aminobacter carboxidus]|uniref:Uncharacterized protein n=1 Tax=Aminobacter carboxidus TaxID=376165 RepID=A0ABR9GSN3_9HYPH|nr:hypothetical protein [Aminobacter carboxidus]MBE1206680.1 hypothetical protein [Aminobacter carboxidus]
MFGMNKFDHMVKRQGDGLLPEMRELFDRLAAIRASENVTDLASYRAQSPIQAGPNPNFAGDHTGANVVSLRSAQKTTTAQRKAR